MLINWKNTRSCTRKCGPASWPVLSRAIFETSPSTTARNWESYFPTSNTSEWITPRTWRQSPVTKLPGNGGRFASRARSHCSGKACHRPKVAVVGIGGSHFRRYFMMEGRQHLINSSEKLTPLYYLTRIHIANAYRNIHGTMYALSLLYINYRNFN